MNNQLILTLPLPPSLNNAFFNAKINLRIPKQATKDWVMLAKLKAAKACKCQNWTITNDKKLVMELTYFWPDFRKYDCDNRSKVLCDALEKIVYENDRCLLPRVMDFSVDKLNPRVEIKIYEFGDLPKISVIRKKSYAVPDLSK